MDRNRALRAQQGTDLCARWRSKSDDKTLQVASNAGRDTMAVYRYDPHAKKLGELIAQHPRYDMGAAADGSSVRRRHHPAREPTRSSAIAVNAAKPESGSGSTNTTRRSRRRWIASLPDRINSVPAHARRQALLVTSYSDTMPARWYLFDEDKRTLEEIGSVEAVARGQAGRAAAVHLQDARRPGDPRLLLPAQGLQAGHQAAHDRAHPRRPIRARRPLGQADSASSRGNYSPRAATPSSSPTSASRPAWVPRSTTAASARFGRQMSDDHEDALKWGIEQGFVDPARVCISGASYGGYAALQALVRTTTCGSARWPASLSTDLKYQITTARGRYGLQRGGCQLLEVGPRHRRPGRRSGAATSRRFHADKIKRPGIPVRRPGRHPRAHRPDPRHEPRARERRQPAQGVRDQGSAKATVSASSRTASIPGRRSSTSSRPRSVPEQRAAAPRFARPQDHDR